MRFYVYSPTYFIRPKNTDWLYTRLLPLVSQFTSDFDIYLQRAPLQTLEYNLRYAAEVARLRFHLPIPHQFELTPEHRFSHLDLRRSGADVIYGESPTNVNYLPLICHMGPLDEKKMRDKQVPQSMIDKDKAIKIRTLRRSHLVTLNSRFGVETICALAPDAAEKIRSVPFFLPHLNLAPRQSVEEKFSSPAKLKLLFVGRQARLKGLPAVLAAFQRADHLYPGRLELSIISCLSDGPVDIPKMPNIFFRGETNRKDVMAAMLESHMLLMPSLYDSYGWVYLEAMSKGAVAMACDAPAQQEIVAGGTAGILVHPNSEAVTDALLSFLAHPEKMLPLALKGWERIRDTYLPNIVAEQIKQLGFEARERFKAGRL